MNIESHERDELMLEIRSDMRNQSFSNLKDFLEDEILTHSELVTRINLAAQNYRGFDFTEEINELLRENI